MCRVIENWKQMVMDIMESNNLKGELCFPCLEFLAEYKAQYCTRILQRSSIDLGKG